MKLLIVESPNKTKKIQSALGVCPRIHFVSHML